MPDGPTKVGEDLALVLDRSTWQSSGIDGETALEVDADETVVPIRPRSVGHRAKVAASALGMMGLPNETFRKPA